MVKRGLFYNMSTKKKEYEIQNRKNSYFFLDFSL